MDLARWQRLNELFHDAIGRAAGERRAWLESTCEGDATLAAEVERLVCAHERATGFIRTGDSPNAMDLLRPDTAIEIGGGFAGTERFAVRRRLGVGGMGIVYEVHDRVRDEAIALKTLLPARRAEIYRLKREFRSLADVAHVNLVSLYELFVEGEQCFFTMELVNGVSFVKAIRPPDAGTPDRTAFNRLRSLFEQLVHGVSALHERKKLHRDIKPSNVLVTPEGRVVILDFGLIADVVPGAAGLESRFAGTPAYMSPEQAMGGVASHASDWYTVGVTLYEALTGRVPFDGVLAEILIPKTTSDPPAPIDLDAAVPADLNAVCMGLLCRDPTERLTGAEALQRLAGAKSSAAIGGRARSPAVPFVGRQWELSVLQESFEATRQGRTSAVCVCGPSGIGKSALVRCFVDRLLAHEDVVVLPGRCYENESVPYKALDGVVDSLSHYLASLPPASARELMPRDVAALARVFPVITRVGAAAASRPIEPDADPLSLRRRAFDALRDLLARIARDRRLVISIDDLHWADADSAVLLEELLRPADAPAALLIACFRTEEMASKPFLVTLLRSGGHLTPLPLAPMTDEEAHELIASVVPPRIGSNPDETARIAREAEGNPLFLELLSQYAAGPHPGRRHDPTLAEMLDSRSRELPPYAHRFLEALAICGRPMPPGLVRDAAGVTEDERSIVALLRSASFVRSSGSGERVEIYHDRIREVMAARMDPDRLRATHRRIAHTLIARRIDDPEALFEHWRAAGDHRQSASYADVAAQRASAALAFDRAAGLYRSALELAPDDVNRAGWNEGLATALANAGRPVDAASAYLAAAADAAGSHRLELQRRAADQYLIAGHIDRGIEVMRSVLGAAGVRLPRGPRAALASVLLQRAWLRWRGVTFTERESTAVDPATLLRIDTCWSVMCGMAMVDNVRALDFHTRHLRLALAAGEPYRIARAFAAEAAFCATRGRPARRRVADFTRRASLMSEAVGHPHAIAFSTLTAGMAAVLAGEWKQAARLCDRALTLLRSTCVGVTWELNGAQAFLIGAFLYQGEFREAARRLTTDLATAKDRGNLYLEAELRTRMMSLVLLAADDPEEADRQADEVMQRWWSGGFTRQHYSHMRGRAVTALYRGDGETAWRVVNDARTPMQRALLFHIQVVRIETSYLRGRCALAVATDGAGRRRRRLLSAARREARRLAREKLVWADGFSLLLRAALALLGGDAEAAERHLTGAIEALDRADMKLYAAVARRRLGILQGDRGLALVREAEEWMSSQGIRNSRFMSRMIAPGFPDV